jgi:hypothetical protein
MPIFIPIVMAEGTDNQRGHGRPEKKKTRS